LPYEPIWPNFSHWLLPSARWLLPKTDSPIAACSKWGNVLATKFAFHMHACVVPHKHVYEPNMTSHDLCVE
jgi:hypothetical protein